MGPDQGLKDQEIDDWSDQEDDEPRAPLRGSSILKQVKFKNSSTMSQAYVKDKGYWHWVRSHITVTSAAEMRLHVVTRDEKKMRRVKMALANEQLRDAQGEDQAAAGAQPPHTTRRSKPSRSTSGPV